MVEKDVDLPLDSNVGAVASVDPDAAPDSISDNVIGDETDLGPDADVPGRAFDCEVEDPIAAIGGYGAAGRLLRIFLSLLIMCYMHQLCLKFRYEIHPFNRWIDEA